MIDKPIVESTVRYSLLTLLAVVALVAVGCVAILNASANWAAAMCSISLTGLLLSILGVAYGQGAWRAYSFGFLLTGGGYFLLAYGPGFSDNVEPSLPTTAFFEWVLPMIQEPFVFVPGEQPRGVTITRRGGWRADIPTERHFKTVGHFVSVLVLGLIGGIVARYCFSMSKKECAKAGS